ncbi:STAS/SEC14 domain-containing protein [Marivirga lumbricoides]
MKLPKYATINKTDPSAIIITFTGNKDTDEAFKEYLSELESCYEERVTIGLIFDASKAIIPKLKHQKEQKFWIEKHWVMIKTYCKGTAYVVPGIPMRAVLRFILSFQNQPTIYKVLPSVESAREWLDGLEA